MNTFYIEYRDPLFSIIIFVSIIFLIALASYWWNKYQNKEDTKYLDRLATQFGTLPCTEDTKLLISSSEISQQTWLLLADSYTKNGNFEKSIEIYSELLKLGSNDKRRETMFLLGKTYFKAGFLERSKQVLLSILKTNPRAPLVLHYLLLVYEHMRDYTMALEVLEPLEELKMDVTLDSAYIQTMQILNDTKLDPKKKATLLVHNYQEHHLLASLVFKYLFEVDPVLAWKHFDSSKSELLSDVLWSLDEKDLNLDIISKNGFLRDLFSARGDIALSKSSTYFELDILIKLKAQANATLSFEYMCESCNMLSPFSFSRCSSCHNIDTARIEWHLSKDFSKDYFREANSFV